jgi:hypothetical protein
VHHLGQVTIAHLPGHKPAKGDLGVKDRRGLQIIPICVIGAGSDAVGEALQATR